MYFITTLVATLIAGLFCFLFRKYKKLHFEILLIIYGSATIMWLVDCFYDLGKGEGFISFEFPNHIYISILTIFLGLFLWLILILIINHSKKAAL